MQPRRAATYRQNEHGEEANTDAAECWYYRTFRGTLFSRSDERPLY